MSVMHGQRGLHWIFVPNNPFGALDADHSISRRSISCTLDFQEKMKHGIANSCQDPAKDLFNSAGALFFWASTATACISKAFRPIYDMVAKPFSWPHST